LLFTSERVREAWKKWMRELLTRPNPATGVELKDDPAVALIQIQNEDGIFWYQTNNLPEPQLANLRTAFAEWVTEKHGSLEKAFESWGSAKLEKDSVENGQAELYVAWELGQPADGDKARRIADQLAFLAHHQRGVYAELDEFLKNDLQIQQLTSGSNWRTVDDNLLMDVERYTNTANDVIALNRYTGPRVHLGERRGYAIMPGDLAADNTVLKNPEKLAVAVKQVSGHPFVLTENSWVFPNRYISEGPTLIAAYSALSGVDTAVWSMAKGPWWRSEPAYAFTVNSQPWIYKHEVMTPDAVGQFPANALAFRRGDVKQAEQPVVHEARALQNLWDRDIPLISEGRSFDPLRDPGDFADQSPVKQEIDPRAFLVGPVTVSYGQDPTESRVEDLSPYIQDQQIRSMTGEILMDTATGLCRVDTPRYQSAAGFFQQAGEPLEFSTSRITSDNEYGAINIVSLEDKPIAEAGKVLIQCGMLVRPEGWRTEPAKVTPKGTDKPIDGYKVTATGKNNWRIANTQAEVEIRNPNLSSAVVLDPNGYPTGEVTLEKTADGVKLTLPPNALYTVLRAEGQ
jgi:hypothetical protein